MNQSLARAESRSRSGLRVVVCETEAEVSALLPQWEKLLDRCANTTIFSTWEWLGPWWRAYGRGDFRLAAFYDESSALVAIAPLFVEQRQELPHLTLRWLHLMGDRTGDSDYLDCLVLPGREREFADALLEYLSSAKVRWDVGELNTVPAISAGVAALEAAMARAGWPSRTETSSGSCIELPPTWDEYLNKISSKERGKIRYRSQRLNKLHQVQFRKCTEISELDGCLEHLFALHQKRWNSKGEPGSFASSSRRDFYRHLGRELLTKERLELWLLELDGRPVAAQFGFVYRQAAYSLQEGFDPDLTQESVGYVLRAHVLRVMIESGMRYYDFLGGSSESKERWNAEPRQFKHVQLARPQSLGAIYFKARWFGEDSREWLRERLPSPALELIRKMKQGSS